MTPDKHADAIVAAYGSGCTLEHVGAEFALSGGRVRLSLFHQSELPKPWQLRPNLHWWGEP
jgi:hypothetical protein